MKVIHEVRLDDVSAASDPEKESVEWAAALVIDLKGSPDRTLSK